MARVGLPDGETMGTIEEVYDDLETDVSLEDFRAAVEEKVEEMAGLADAETAAMLIAHELRDETVAAIGDIKPGMEEVKFLAKVRQIGELRSFDREGDEEGHVINVEGIDETGSVRMAFWDEQATAIDGGELDVGDVLRVKGRPKEGYGGIEVSVHQAEPDEDAEIDVDLSAPQQIEDLSVGQEGVDLRGVVLDVDPIRTFDRDDGSEGRVANLVIGDETGRIRITLWDDQTEAVDAFDPGNCVTITGASVRERDGSIECHVGNRGAVEPSDEEVAFAPNPTPIATLEEGSEADIAGVIRSTDPVREFDRDDGTTGQVRNVRVQDGSGDIRVALWGDAADRDFAPGDTVWFGSVEIRDGWQDDLEASVSWQSSIAAIDPEHVSTEPVEPEAASPSAEGSAQLDTFSNEDAPEPEPGEVITFTGTVVQTGDPVIVDNGEDAYRIETDSTVTLGQRVTVEGERRGERIDAERVAPADGKR